MARLIYGSHTILNGDWTYGGVYKNTTFGTVTHPFYKRFFC